VLRDPNAAMIDTNLTGSLIVEMGLFPATSAQAAKW
jgi:hypothetical protein